jgi:periplasmic protein TonB
MNGINGYVASPRSQPISRVRPWIAPPNDPLDRILDLGGKKTMRMMTIALAFTLAFHGAAAARAAYIHAEVIRWTLHTSSVIDRKLSQEIDIEQEQAKVVVPHEEEKKEEQPLERKALPKDQPAAAAKAAHILAADPDSEVLDFKDVFIQGDNDRAAGGLTAKNGTNDRPPVQTHVASGGTGNGQAAQPQVMAVDLSRTAQLAGSGEWRCPFPPEADSDQVDEAAAIIEVVVGADGKAQRATVLQDPGHGFGREARQCALREAYVPALDRDGATVASSKKFRVKFER